MKPYRNRSLRKVKGGYKASVYILASAEGKTKIQAQNALNRKVWEMECNRKNCCQPRVFTTSGTFNNLSQFLVSTK